MAWLQNLAGRAEDLLNKIDQNAATVLSDSGNRVPNQENDIIARQENKSYGSSSESDNNDSNEAKSLSFDDEFVSAKPSSTEELSDNVTLSYDLVADDMFEKTSKSGSPGSKAMSSHNSFILTEDIQSYVEKINSLELQVQDLNKQLLNVQHVYAELRNENINLQNQVATSNDLVATAQSEMEQYKVRAQRILQEKEDLILLKNQNDISDNSKHILENYGDALKKEIEFQQNKNIEFSEKVVRLNQEISFLQQQILLTQKSAQQSTEALEQNLMTEKKFRVIAEEDCRTRIHELHVTREELAQQINLVEQQSEEISALQEALKKKTDVNFTSDYEKRIKTLTDTLMLKQNALETITTEKNALHIQLEKTQAEYRNSLAQLDRAQVRVVNMNDTDDVKSQVPHFMRVLPSDAGVTRRVKHAYSTVDAISVKTGIFLRRYPVARVFVFCYMVLLHFWALLLLFLYAPSNR